MLRLGRKLWASALLAAVTTTTTLSTTGEVQTTPTTTSQLVFTGTGTSEGIPRVSCLTSTDGVVCPVCHDSVKPGSKNRRTNTGAIIRYQHEDGRTRHIAIDVGKFFYQSAINLFPKLGLRDLDAVVLTHDHADAIFGLDDLRDWTAHVRGGPLPIYVGSDHYPGVAARFPYLIPSNKHLSTGSGFVPTLEFHVVNKKEKFTVEGLEFTPLPVEHGKNYQCLGFRFGRVAYISDVSEILPETMELLEFKDVKEGEQPERLELLVLDALNLVGTHPSHITLEQAIPIIRRLRPNRTLLIGMSHVVDHEGTNKFLKKLLHQEGLSVELAYDGQVVDLYSLK